MGREGYERQGSGYDPGAYGYERQGRDSKPKRETHGRIQGRKGQELRQRRLKRTNYLCEMCLPDRTTLAEVVDHIEPLALGGLDVDENTRNLCNRHHAEVTAQQFGLKAPKKQIAVDGWPVED